MDATVESIPSNKKGASRPFGTGMRRQWQTPRDSITLVSAF